MIQLVELTKLADKQKWQRRFLQAYEGETVEESAALYGKNVRFFIAVRDEKELGFIRINDKSAHFKDVYDGPVWNVTDGYVKQAYRHQGVLREMIVQAVSRLDVKMLYVETDRFERNLGYYRTLGFSLDWTVKGGQFTWAFHDSFADIAKQAQYATS